MMAFLRRPNILMMEQSLVITYFQYTIGGVKKYMKQLLGPTVGTELTKVKCVNKAFMFIR